MKATKIAKIFSIFIFFFLIASIFFIGANMILGLRTEGNGTVRQSRELLANFREKCGAVVCKDLKGVGTGKVLCECADCVRNAVKALGEILGE